ncbi:MAG: hypothetical protein IK107_05885, partial [Oscillospiraceae bacterium]|nr:hypothetical protein [Oscillospiraceae bacterium]
MAKQKTNKLHIGITVLVVLLFAGAVTGITLFIRSVRTWLSESMETEISVVDTLPTVVTTAETTVTTTTATMYPAAPVPDDQSLQIADTELVTCQSFILAAVNEGDDTVLAERA